MHFWKWFGIGYLVLSVFMTLTMFVILFKEDLRLDREPWRKANSKFGYNLRRNGPGSVWGLGWWMTAGCLPAISLIVLAFFMFCRITGCLEQRRIRRERSTLQR